MACVLQSYPEKFRYYDIMIGNGGVLESQVAADPSPQLLQTWRDDNLRPVDSVPCNQLTNRSEAKKEDRHSTPLESNCLDFKMSYADLAEMQRKDSSLAHFFVLYVNHPRLIEREVRLLQPLSSSGTVFW